MNICSFKCPQLAQQANYPDTLMGLEFVLFLRFSQRTERAEVTHVFPPN